MLNVKLYPVQEEFIKDCKSVIDTCSVGIFSSPTGTGKTISLLSSVIAYIDTNKGLSLENKLLFDVMGTDHNNSKIIYASRTHSQLNQVITELKKYKTNITATILCSRKNYCINDKINYNEVEIINEKCKNLTKHNRCKYYKIENITELLDIEELISTSKKSGSCPFYTSRNTSKNAEIILLPYQLLFSKEGRNSIDLDINNSIIVIDEAHNIYQSIIGIYTVEINRITINTLVENIKRYKEKYKERMENTNILKLNVVISIFERIKVFFNKIKETEECKNRDLIKNNIKNSNSPDESKDINPSKSNIKYIDNTNNMKSNGNIEEYTNIISVSEFLLQSDLVDYNFLEIENYLLKTNLLSKVLENDKDINNSNINSITNKYNIIKFLKLLTESDEHGRILYSNIKIKFTPMNPQMYFEDILKCRALILAGGTMEPVESVLRLLGVENTEGIENSNLKQANIKTINDKNIKYFSYNAICTDFLPLIIPKGTTDLKLVYEERDKKEVEIVNILYNLSNTIKKGGAVYFFPSKKYLNSIKETIKNKFKNKNIIFEEDFYKENKKDDDITPSTIKTFKDYAAEVKNKAINLFCIMGGRLSEGINFNDNLCRLLVIIGVPYPTLNLELKERINIFNNGLRNNSTSCNYSTLLAMNTINQTLGRAIRHKNDYSAMVLLDSRYINLKNYISPWIKDKITIESYPQCLRVIYKYLNER